MNAIDWLAIAIIIGEAAIIAVLLVVHRSLADYQSSNALLSAQVVQALAEIARIRAGDRTPPNTPNPTNKR